MLLNFVNRFLELPSQIQNSQKTNHQGLRMGKRISFQYVEVISGTRMLRFLQTDVMEEHCFMPLRGTVFRSYDTQTYEVLMKSTFHPVVAILLGKIN